ncbi:MAG: hemolysin family protein [Pseudomonadota bacterium]
MPLDSEDSNFNTNNNGNNSNGFWSRLLGKPDNSARDALEEYVGRVESDEPDSASQQEKQILANVLKMRNIKVEDVMVPRADIIAIDVDIGEKDLLQVFAEKQCSRIPVFKESLDNILGTIHVKDVLSSLAEDMIVRADRLIVELPVVSPTMDVLDLVLDMRQKRRHMALVVDEYGGVDGLVTLSDVIEEIVGDIDDEHMREEDPEVLEQEDGTYIADARFDIEDFEERYGELFSDTEREESDTLGGLVCNLAGRVPAKGEVFNHASGVIFEVLDGDPRRLNLIRIHNLVSA